jgi:hypothetical protein
MMGAVKNAFRDEIVNQASRDALDMPRDRRGRFTTLRCVNAHDRCYGGAGGPCPYCEPKETA